MNILKNKVPKIKILIIAVLLTTCVCTQALAVVTGTHGDDNHDYTFDVSGTYSSSKYTVNSYTGCEPYHYSRAQAVKTIGGTVVADSSRIWGYGHVSSTAVKDGYTTTLDYSARGYWGH